jgi:hypothetical protein
MVLDRALVNSVERPQASSPALSTGYADNANDFFTAWQEFQTRLK